MSKQPEALRLADACEQAATIADMGRPPIAADWRRLSAAELRRLHSVNADLLEALTVARQFMSIASDWNIDEAEINGEMRSTYDWIEVLDAAIAKAEEA